MGVRLAARRVRLECPRCAQSSEHELTRLEQDGSLSCVSCGGSFPVDPVRLARMAQDLRSVDALLERWRAPPEP
ncbi:MAG TPA: YnfU family zinc-binding protein [Burkholderiales bacterium]|nr:YnfU family zinc-binding protein [Burkholderiales bacterium]